MKRMFLVVVVNDGGTEYLLYEDPREALYRGLFYIRDRGLPPSHEAKIMAEAGPLALGKIDRVNVFMNSEIPLEISVHALEVGQQ